MQGSTFKEGKEQEYECLTDEFKEHFKMGQKIFVRGNQVYDNEKNLIDVDVEYIRNTPSEFKPVEAEKKELPKAKRADTFMVYRANGDRLAIGSEEECHAAVSVAPQGEYVLARAIKTLKVKHEIKVTEGEV
jgi:hypothetical protein